MKIAVGWDGRDGGYDALVLGRLLATALAAEVQVVHVATDEPTSRDLDEDYERALGDSGLTAGIITVAERAPADALAAIATNGDADLLMLGSTHQAGFGRVHPGAVGERLLGHVGCPMAIAPRGFAERTPIVDGGRYLRVLAVGFDGSPESRAALGFAAELAAAVNATVRVIAVDAPVPYDLRGAPRGHTAAAAPTVDLQDKLAAAVDELPGALRAQRIFERGDAAAAVTGHTEEGVDLLLIGSREHGRVGSLLGSTARTIVRRAQCPVMVMPPSRSAS